MSKLSVYVKGVNTELRKMTWPTWSQLQSSAILVMVASIILAAIILLMDLAFRNLLTLIYHWLF